MKFEDTTKWPQVRDYLNERLAFHRKELEGVSVENLSKLQARIETIKHILNNEKTATEA